MVIYIIVYFSFMKLCVWGFGERENHVQWENHDLLATHGRQGVDCQEVCCHAVLDKKYLEKMHLG